MWSGLSMLITATTTTSGSANCHYDPLNARLRLGRPYRLGHPGVGVEQHRGLSDRLDDMGEREVICWQADSGVLLEQQP